MVTTESYTPKSNPNCYLELKVQEGDVVVAVSDVPEPTDLIYNIAEWSWVRRLGDSSQKKGFVPRRILVDAKEFWEKARVEAAAREEAKARPLAKEEELAKAKAEAEAA